MNPLPADNLVDTHPLVRCSCDCYPPLSAVIQQLCNEWRENRANKRQNVVFARLAKTVDVVMANYRAQLALKFKKRSSGRAVDFSRYLRQFGRLKTEARIIHLHRLIRSIIASASPIRYSLQELVSASKTLDAPHSSSVPSELAVALHELLDTLDTLRSLANVVSSFRPKARLIKHVNIRRRAWDHTCRFCEEPTEMQAFAEGKITLRIIDGGRQRLSPSLCRTHRSRGNDGQASSDYKRLQRGESELQRELQALRWASVRKGPEQPGLEATLLYEFRRRIVDARNLYLYHEAELAEEARSLQMQGMSDRKKLIVMMLCAREGVGSIAKRLGVTRQAVYKAIQNVPARYQFEDSAQTGPSLVRIK